MQHAFENLIATKELWLPALSRAVAALSATGPGRRIENGLKEKLAWLRNSEFEKAFFEAFTIGVERYSAERGSSVAARSAARILTQCVEDRKSSADLSLVLDQIFSDGAYHAALLEMVSKRAVVLEDARVSPEESADELRILLRDYLRPAFRAQPQFTERVGFAELTGLVRDIRALLATDSPDLAALGRDYRAKLVNLYEIIPMQGISPKVHNRTIGIQMEEVFIPLKATPEDIVFDPGMPLGATLKEWTTAEQMPFELLSWSKALHTTRPTSVALTAPERLTLEMIDAAVLKNQPIKFADVVSAYTFRTPAEMQASAEPKDWKLFRNWLANLSVQTPATIKTLLGAARVVVRGDPGCGKSTLMRYIAWALASGKTEIIGQNLAARLPVFVRAIDFGEALERGQVESLEEYLAEDAGRFALLVKSAIAAGDSILLIDGLDEVSKPALRARVKESVDEFIADPAFAQNRIVITTRIVGYQRTGLTGQFRHFTVSELDDQQIRTFIVRWYGAMERVMPAAINSNLETDELYEAITTNESVHRMARNPLLLTIIALIKWQGRALPDSRVLLYDAAAQTVIKSWPLFQRRVEFDELFIREWLAPVALHILADRTGDLIDEFSLMDELVGAMRRLKSKTEMEAKSESRALLEGISEHSGFLLPRGLDDDGRNLYGFLHQTFAEFLAAYALAGQWEDGQLNLKDYAHDPYWREVLLLLAGHLGTQRRAKAGAFIQAVRSLQSSAYEHVVHRDLMLACQILGDGVPAGPANIVESLLSGLLAVWGETPILSLRKDIEATLEKLRGTEYAGVAARLALERKPPAKDIIALAGVLGPVLFEKALQDVLSDQQQAPSTILEAAELLTPNNPRVADVLSKLSVRGDEATRFGVTRLLLEDGDPSGIGLLKELLKTSRVWVLAKPNSLAGCKRPDARDAVAALLESADARLEANAAGLLTQWEDKRGVKALLRLASSADLEVTGTVWTTVRDAKPGVLDDCELVKLLQVPGLQLRLLAAHQLAVRGDIRGVQALVDLLNAPDIGVRLTAAIRLNERDDPRAIPAFVSLLSELDKGRTFYATGPLAKHGVPEGLAMLRAFLEDREPVVRVQAASQLLESGETSAQGTLLEILPAGGSLASLAFQALVKWGSVPLPELCPKLLDQPDPGLAWVVMEVLSRREEPAALEILIGLLEDARPFVRAHAAELLVQREEPSVLVAVKQCLERMLNETDAPPDPRQPASVRPPAESAYKFLKRHLTPAGALPDWSAQ